MDSEERKRLERMLGLWDQGREILRDIQDFKESEQEVAQTLLEQEQRLEAEERLILAEINPSALSRTPEEKGLFIKQQRLEALRRQLKKIRTQIAKSRKGRK